MRRATMAAALLVLGCGGGASASANGDASGDGTIADASASDTIASDVVDTSIADTSANETLSETTAETIDETSDAIAEIEATPPTGPILPSISCLDALTDVYVRPAGLPTYDPSHRGDVVRCALDTLLDTTTVQSQLTGKSLLDVPVTTAVQLVRIAYRTERADGVEGISTARVYLPSTPRPAPLPIITIGHPSNGLADSCAPSMDPTSMQDLALPWASRGYAVIAPDYAGLGNEGTQGYLDNRDTAHSLLDGARALRKLVSSDWFTSKVVMFGHSQGGGGALSAQALAGSYGLDGTLAAVAVFSPEWPSRLNSFGFVTDMQAPTELTVIAGITKPTVAEALAYAHSKNYTGPTYDQVTVAANASGLANAADTLCLTPYGGYLQGVAVHLNDLFSAAEQTTFLACVADPTSAGCTAPGQDLYQFMLGNVLHGDPAGAPILYVQAMLDTIMPANEEAACNLDKLAADGVHPTICTDATGIHTNVVVNNIVFAMKWAEALVAGTTPPTCTNSGMPACSLP
ncbi:MAG: alpha/beta hydrolase family protein [Polyangiales bacterium]